MYMQTKKNYCQLQKIKLKFLKQKISNYGTEFGEAIGKTRQKSPNLYM